MFCSDSKLKGYTLGTCSYIIVVNRVIKIRVYRQHNVQIEFIVHNLFQSYCTRYQNNLVLHFEDKFQMIVFVQHFEWLFVQNLIALNPFDMLCYKMYSEVFKRSNFVAWNVFETCLFGAICVCNFVVYNVLYTDISINGVFVVIRQK